jgi:hypothetical protein
MVLCNTRGTLRDLRATISVSRDSSKSLSHPPEGVIGQTNRIDGDRPTISISGVGMQTVVHDVTAGVVGRRETSDVDPPA